MIINWLFVGSAIGYWNTGWTTLLVLTVIFGIVALFKKKIVAYVAESLIQIEEKNNPELADEHEKLREELGLSKDKTGVADEVNREQNIAFDTMISNGTDYMDFVQSLLNLYQDEYFVNNFYSKVGLEGLDGVVDLRTHLNYFFNEFKKQNDPAQAAAWILLEDQQNTLRYLFDVHRVFQFNPNLESDNSDMEWFYEIYVKPRKEEEFNEYMDAHQTIEKDFEDWEASNYDSKAKNNLELSERKIKHNLESLNKDLGTDFTEEEMMNHLTNK